MRNFFCFIHMEKAAGTTLHQLLLDNLPNYMAIHPGYLPRSVRDDYLLHAKQLMLLRKLCRPCGVGGHFVRSYLGYEEAFSNHEIDYFTFLREPRKRYVSHYIYQVDTMGLKQTFEQFLERRELDDLQCKRACGVGSFESAREELKKYKHVGVMEEFGKCMTMLNADVFDSCLRPTLRQKNTSQRSGDLSSRLLEEYGDSIVDRNIEDIKLYEYQKSLIVDRARAAEDFFDQEYKDVGSGGFQYLKKGRNRYFYEPLTYALSRVC